MSEIARGALQQGKSGKLVARARIMELLDDHSFVELDRYLQISNVFWDMRMFVYPARV